MKNLILKSTVIFITAVALTATCFASTEKKGNTLRGRNTLRGLGEMITLPETVPTTTIIYLDTPPELPPMPGINKEDGRITYSGIPEMEPEVVFSDPLIQQMLAGGTDGEVDLYGGLMKGSAVLCSEIGDPLINGETTLHLVFTGETDNWDKLEQSRKYDTYEQNDAVTTMLTEFYQRRTLGRSKPNQILFEDVTGCWIHENIKFNDTMRRNGTINVGTKGDGREEVCNGCLAQIAVYDFDEEWDYEVLPTKYGSWAIPHPLAPISKRAVYSNTRTSTGLSVFYPTKVEDRRDYFSGTDPRKLRSVRIEKELGDDGTDIKIYDTEQFAFKNNDANNLRWYRQVIRIQFGGERPVTIYRRWPPAKGNRGYLSMNGKVIYDDEPITDEADAEACDWIYDIVGDVSSSGK